MLTGSRYFELRFTRPYSSFYCKEQVLSRHTLMSVHCIDFKHILPLLPQHTYWIPSLSAIALSVDTKASLRPTGKELLPIGAINFFNSVSKAKT